MKRTLAITPTARFVACEGGAVQRALRSPRTRLRLRALRRVRYTRRMTVVVYHYPACSTCRKALKWLEARGIAHERVHIVEKPPSRALLVKAAKQLPLRALFNTSGQSYRDGNFKERLPKLTQAEAIDALARDGKLIKRPLLVHGEAVLTGFGDAEWEKVLG
jgi:arsenate reductase